MGHERRVFENYNMDELNASLSFIAENAKLGVRLLAELVEGPESAVLVDFRSTDTIVFQVPPAFASSERRDFYTNRWLATCYLFSVVKYRFPRLVGGCRLWLDDVPRGSGMVFCGSTASHVLLPDAAFLETDGYRVAVDHAAQNWRAWSQRESKVIWRGASTGDRQKLRISDWRDIPRMKLCLIARDIQATEIFDVGLTQIVQVWEQEEIDAIKASGILRDPIPQQSFMDYKYAIDIDGNSCSWPGLFSKLIFGNTILKVDSPLGFRQWYYHRLIPWKNFVPIASDMSDLVEAADWLLDHPAEAQQIAQRAQELARSLSYEAVIDEAVDVVVNCISR